MDNSRKSYAFYLNKNISDEAKLMLWIDDQAGQNFSKFFKEILHKLKAGKIAETDKEDLARKKMLVDIELKEVMIKLKEHELIYRQTFEQTPPPKT